MQVRGLNIKTLSFLIYFDKFVDGDELIKKNKEREREREWKKKSKWFMLKNLEFRQVKIHIHEFI